MKKLIYGTLSLALVGIGVVGCKKENKLPLVESNKSEISTDGKMLIFKTVKSYENSVEDLSEEKREKVLSEISKLNFKNYFSVDHLNSKSGYDSIQEMDEFLGQLLNEDGVIQIGNYIYKVNLLSEKVFVLPVSNSAEYLDLVNENKSNKNIRQFPAGDDVIYLAESGASGEKCGGIGGGSYPCYENINQGQIVATLANGNVWRLNPGVKFFRAGIYFRLSSLYEIWAFASSTATANGTKVNNINGLFTVEIFCKGPKGWCQKRPCGSGDIKTVNSGLYYSKNLSNYQQTFYSGSRNLNGYHFFVQGRAKFPNGTATIASPYGGRNINSPY